MSAPTPTDTKTYRGSCHCGHVAYSVTLPSDPSKIQHSKCNCTICTKNAMHNIRPTDISSFVLTSPPGGTSEIGDYTFGSNIIHHYFCQKCGTKMYARGNVPALGGDALIIALATLDDVDLSAFKCESYLDGRGNNWSNGPSQTPIAPGGW